MACGELRPTKTLIEAAVREHPIGMGLATFFQVIANTFFPIALAACRDPFGIEQTGIRVVLHRADGIPFAGHGEAESVMDERGCAPAYSFTRSRCSSVSSRMVSTSPLR